MPPLQGGEVLNYWSHSRKGGEEMSNLPTFGKVCELNQIPLQIGCVVSLPYWVPKPLRHILKWTGLMLGTMNRSREPYCVRLTSHLRPMRKGFGVYKRTSG